MAVSSSLFSQHILDMIMGKDTPRTLRESIIEGVNYVLNPSDTWLLCDGRSIPLAKYPELARATPTPSYSSYTECFSVPDMRGRPINPSPFISDTIAHGDTVAYYVKARPTPGDAVGTVRAIYTKGGMPACLEDLRYGSKAGRPLG